MPTGHIPCITVWQPWATLMVGMPDYSPGPKDIENRNWQPKINCPCRVLIHAGKTLDRKWCVGSPPEWWNLFSLDEVRMIMKLTDDLESLPRGQIIGEVMLIGFTRDSDSPWAAPGQVHWRLESRKAFDNPVPYRGRQGIFRVPGEFIQGAYNKGAGHAE